MSAHAARGGFVLLASLLALACQQRPTDEFTSTPCEPIEHPHTHEILLPLSNAMIYEQRRPDLSATGSDYLHVLPLEVSHNGYQLLYLWVGVASTIDHGLSRGRLGNTTPTALRLDALTMPLVEWDSGRALKASANMPITQVVRGGISQTDLNRLIRAPLEEVALIWPSGEESRFARVAAARNHWRYGTCDA